MARISPRLCDGIRKQLQMNDQTCKFHACLIIWLVWHSGPVNCGSVNTNSTLNSSAISPQIMVSVLCAHTLRSMGMLKVKRKKKP